MDDRTAHAEPYTTLPRRLIAPVTLAHDSLEAAALAVTLAAALGAELVLAGIAPFVWRERSGPGDDVLEEIGQQRLVDSIVAERLEELAGALPPQVVARTLMSHGPIGEALAAAAREERADLVVVPMRRESQLAHLVHDHADRYVLHHCEVPVLVVPTSGSARDAGLDRAA